MNQQCSTAWALDAIYRAGWRQRAAGWSPDAAKWAQVFMQHCGYMSDVFQQQLIARYAVCPLGWCERLTEEIHPAGTLYVRCPKAWAKDVAAALGALYPGDLLCSQTADDQASFALDVPCPDGEQLAVLSAIDASVQQQLQWEWYPWNYVTLVNSHPTQAIELDLEVYQGRLDSVEVVTLATDEIHVHNTFEQLDQVKPRAPKTLQAEGARVRVPLVAGSVTRVMGKLG